MPLAAGTLRFRREHHPRVAQHPGIRKGSPGFQGLLSDGSIGRLLPDFDFHSRLSAHAMHDISSNLAGRRRVCLLHYSQRAIAGHAH